MFINDRKYVRRIAPLTLAAALVILLQACVSPAPPSSDEPAVTVSPSPTPTAVSAPPLSTKTEQPSPSAQPDTVAAFSTPILESTENRNTNLELAAAALSGHVIKVGEEFSFNETVGPRTEEKGYKEAHVFINGEEENETGGGVCQVATTLYNAALGAGFEILERNQHSDEVHYIELGKDATVYYGQLDMRFKNTSDRDVEIVASVTDDEVRVALKER